VDERSAGALLRAKQFLLAAANINESVSMGLAVFYSDHDLDGIGALGTWMTRWLIMVGVIRISVIGIERDDAMDLSTEAAIIKALDAINGMEQEYEQLMDRVEQIKDRIRRTGG
jgi:hypothetical protein